MMALTLLDPLHGERLTDPLTLVSSLRQRSHVQYTNSDSVVPPEQKQKPSLLSEAFVSRLYNQ